MITCFICFIDWCWLGNWNDRRVKVLAFVVGFDEELSRGCLEGASIALKF
jgi:hypothetical protein